METLAIRTQANLIYTYSGRGAGGEEGMYWMPSNVND